MRRLLPSGWLRASRRCPKARSARYRTTDPAAMAIAHVTRGSCAAISMLGTARALRARRGAEALRARGGRTRRLQGARLDRGQVLDALRRRGVRREEAAGSAVAAQAVEERAQRPSVVARGRRDALP